MIRLFVLQKNQELKELFALNDKNFVFACGGEIVRKGYDEKVIGKTGI